MPKKIIAYHTVVWSTTKDFNQKVNDKIDEGYQPYGDLQIMQSVAVTDHASKDLYESGAMYCQAMVMYDDAEDF
jgi:hypothetical protein